jgi:glycosyltransferase involved in cell wall biosynthesis
MPSSAASDSAPLRLTYLLEGSGLFGGTKVALRQANLMVRRGHRVTVASREPAPDWMSVVAHFVLSPTLAPSTLPQADVTVATYWTTIAPAVAAPGREAVHYCQGFEASYTHNRSDHPRILEAYATEVPALCVAPHLAELLRRRFGRPARVVPQPLEPEMQPRGRQLTGRRFRILVVSPFEIDWKGVATALAAVKLLRGEGFDCRLVRLSQWPLSDAEREQLAPEEYHHHLPSHHVARLMQSCDLLLAPSWEQEGFGLPVLEAMACGLPVVCSDVSCYRSYAAGAALLVPPDNPRALAAAARQALTEPGLWRRMRRAGLLVAAAYSESRAATEAEAALRWVASGAWRSES